MAADLRRRAAELRQQGMTQQQVADTVGVDRTTITKWEASGDGNTVTVENDHIISAPPDLRIRIPRAAHDIIYERVTGGAVRRKKAPAARHGPNAVVAGP